MRRLLHRVVSVLSWSALLVLGAFGIYFSFANYPVYGIVVTLAVVVVVGYSERSRRQARVASERARRQART
jgi:K+-sensing histidine kinase KdpD